jgi:YD repeat-containing protein
MSRIPFVKLLLVSLALCIIVSFQYVATSLAGTVTYEYDELDRLHAVILENGQEIIYEYDKIGNMVSRTAAGAVIITTSSLPPGIAGTLYSQTLAATGGDAPYGTWSIANGSLPAGLTLDATNGVISGTPTSVGSSPFTVQVPDSLGYLASRDLTITVGPAVSITTTTLPVGVSGNPYSQTLAATGGMAPYTWSLASGSSLPAGLSLNASGVISGTPTTAGNSTFTVQVSDHNGALASAPFTVAILAGLPNYYEMIAAPALPAGWSVQGTTTISTIYHSSIYGLQLGDGNYRDGSVSFVARATGRLTFWYYKTSEWGYYTHEDDWYAVGANVGTVTISVNGSVVYTTSSDTGWVQTPPVSVHAGDTIQISQAGSRDDDGSYCNNLSGYQCLNLQDPYYDITVYIDDVRISNDLTPPITTATPGGGTYYGTQTVTLSANESATTYYTTDGMTPTTNSAVYSTPLTLSATTTLKYFSVDVAENVEPINTQTYTIYPGGPPYNEGFATQTIPTGWSVQGVASIDTMNYSAPYSLLLGDGYYKDGGVSFVAPVSGNFSFWYYKVGLNGYYKNDYDVVYTGTNVGAMNVFVNGALVFVATTDTEWVKTPLFTVHEGDTIRIAEVGNSDDGGALCGSGECSAGADLFTNISVYIDDVAITSGPDVAPPYTMAAPSGGSYGSTQTVTLSTNESAIIYYTTDGSTPTTGSAVYSAPLTIAVSTTLKYFAVDTAGNAETVKSQTYAIDTTPPVTTATPAGGTYASAQTVTLSANEPATIYYTTNGTTPTTSSSVYSAPLTISASTTLKYFARDLAGNSETVKTQTYVISPSDAGSINQATPGTYTHTFTSNATVTLTYLNGAGGGGGTWDNEEDGRAGGISTIVYDGGTIATANGGGGGDGNNDANNGAPGTASNSFTGATNTTGGGNPGGAGAESGGNGGNGGAVTGGTFPVASGKTISVNLGGGGSGRGGYNGTNASVSFSWR